MTVKLGSNIASISAQRRLAENTSALSRTFERLSSGQRINRASDDAAGLAISDSLRADARVFNQGVRNLNDGVSLLNIADSAIENLSSIMVRLEELAEQSANGTYGATQRKALNAEAQALSAEYFRLTRSTTFNGRGLFYNEFGELRLQSGYGLDGGIQSGLGGAIGTGTFSQRVSYGGINFGVNQIASGDLNGDGLIDVVTSGGGVVNFAVGLGQVGGGFAIGQVTEIGNSNDVMLGDINNDGKLDMVNVGSLFGNPGLITTRIGIGNGTFGGATTTTQTGAGNVNIIAGILADFNNDGNLDLGFSMIETGGPETLRIKLGAGNGTFGSSISFAETYTPTSIAAGDLNGDGILDIITAGSDGLGGFSVVRLGDGNGSFGAATSFSMEGTGSNALTLADLNSDGKLDLLTAGVAGTDGYMTVRLGIGSGTFGAAVSYLQHTGGTVTELKIADLNGDGFLDAVTGSATVATIVRMGTGTGSFNQAVSYAGTTGALHVNDFNADGVPDIMTGVGGGTAYLHLNNANVVDGISPLLPFDISTMAGALQALPVFKMKLDKLAAQRGEIGAFQSRVQVATNVLAVSSENYKAAESRIRDADIASEAADLARLGILQQSASSVLAQANQQPALALRLLGGV